MNIRGYRLVAIDNKKRKLYYDDLYFGSWYSEEYQRINEV